MRIIDLSAISLAGLLYAHASLSVVAAAEVGQFTGTAVDNEGRAVEGAQVQVYQNLYPKGRNAAPQLVTNMVTRADGTFEFTYSDTAQVVVSKPGLAPGWVIMIPPGRSNHRVTLGPPTTLAGVVLDESGKTVRGAEVHVFFAHFGTNDGWTNDLVRSVARIHFSSQTDADGRFKLENFPANSRAELGVSAPGRVLPPRRVQFGSSKDLLCASGETNIHLVVETAGGVEGRVVTENGEPVPNTDVELQSDTTAFGVPWDPVMSVTNGVFRLTGISSGAYRVFARFGPNALPDWVAEPVPVVVGAGQTLRDVEVKAVRGSVLQVTCIDKRTGAPVPEIFLTIYTGSDFVHSTSDTNGFAAFRILPGSHRVVGTKSELRSQFAETKLESGQTNLVKMEFSFPPIISGTVRDPEGIPCPGLPIWIPGGGSRGELKTDANGRFQLVQNESARLVFVMDPVRNLVVCQDIEEGVTNLNLTLQPGLTVTGRVHEAPGKPIPNPILRPYMNFGNMGYPLYWLPIVTNTDGTYKLTGLPTNWTYFIIFGANGYGAAEKKIPTDDGNVVELDPATLKKADLKVMGQVVDASGAPLEGANVYVAGIGQPSMSLRSDANGRFTFDACEGRVTLNGFFRNSQASVEARAGDTNIVIMIKPGSSASEPAEPPKPKRGSLVGKMLPDLGSINLSADAVTRGNRVLVCLFDTEQRPSRHVLRILAEQHESLKSKGITVLAQVSHPGG